MKSLLHPGDYIVFIIYFFTIAIMIAVSLAGPKVSPKAFKIDSSMFKLRPATIALITIILMLIVALYAKFW